MSIYIPDYLAYNDRQFDGWPNGITEEGKRWAVEKVKSLFNQSQHVSLALVREILFQASDRPDDFKGIASYDCQYAIADRALRAADAEQTWISVHAWQRRSFRFIDRFFESQVVSLLFENPETATKRFESLKPSVSSDMCKKFEAWTTNAQIGDIFTIPGQLTVFCVDKASRVAFS